MSPAALVQQLIKDGLTVSRTLGGTIRLDGPMDAIEKYAPLVRAYKPALFTSLPAPTIATREDLMAIPKRPCLLCGQCDRGWCKHYQTKLPEAGRPYRCVHFLGQ